MNEAQKAKLIDLCDRYNVAFNPEDYTVIPADASMMRGWVEGWVGGLNTTLYVGVSPEGQAHS